MRVSEWEREVVLPALDWHSTAISYAWKMKCAHAGWVFQQTQAWLVVRHYFCSSTHTFLTANHLLLNINGEFGWYCCSCYNYLGGVLVMLDFHSKYLCLHSTSPFLFHPELLDILVSFPVYKKQLPTQRMHYIVNIRAWCSGQKWQLPWWPCFHCASLPRFL